MRYPVKLAEEAGGVHETLKLPGSCGSCSAVRPVGWSAAACKTNKCSVHNLFITLEQTAIGKSIIVMIY